MSCPMKAETFLLKIDYHSYCFVNTDQLNVAFDCILMFDLQVLFSLFIVTLLFVFVEKVQHIQHYQQQIVNFPQRSKLETW